MVIDSANEDVKHKLVDEFSSDLIRFYIGTDLIGSELGAAAKNVIAVVYGAFDAVAEHSQIFGDNSQSLLFAAGLNEIQALGMAMGATHPETFTSIAGVGDLDVTCKSEFGRNRRFGQDIIKTDILSNFKNIDDLIHNFRFDIIGVGDFDTAQVTKGGASLNEFNEHLESTYSKGLYATGEVLDVNGKCGGYNLAWAFISAILVSDSI